MVKGSPAIHLAARLFGSNDDIELLQELSDHLGVDGGGWCDLEEARGIIVSLF
jgi:hypothetical protein